MVTMPAKTRIKTTALNRAPIFIPLLLSHVSKRIRIMARELDIKILKWIEYLRYKMLPGRKHRRQMDILFSDEKKHKQGLKWMPFV
jgi:hypothetical protein